MPYDVSDIGMAIALDLFNYPQVRYDFICQSFYCYIERRDDLVWRGFVQDKNIEIVSRKSLSPFVYLNCVENVKYNDLQNFKYITYHDIIKKIERMVDRLTKE